MKTRTKHWIFVNEVDCLLVLNFILTLLNHHRLCNQAACMQGSTNSIKLIMEIVQSVITEKSYVQKKFNRPISTMTSKFGLEVNLEAPKV